MKRTFIYHITENNDHQSILQFLKTRQYSSQNIIHLKKTPRGILLNGQWAYVSDLLHTDDTLEITVTENAISENIIPSPLPLNIVFEDDDLMVVNKAAGMPIHPSQGNYDNTLANAVCHYYLTKNEPFVYRCINRLDRDTSGLLILAKHMYSAHLLSDMVQKKEIQREYLAIASGKTPKSGTISAPIARKANSTIEREVNFESGEHACTHFQTLAYYKDFSLVSLILETGRTHQIRVHMKHIGHPLPGDFLYHPDYTYIHRQALHSHKLSFIHPITGKDLEFIAPLPSDMQSLIIAESAKRHVPGL